MEAKKKAEVTLHGTHSSTCSRELTHDLMNDIVYLATPHGTPIRHPSDTHSTPIGRPYDTRLTPFRHLLGSEG